MCRRRWLPKRYRMLSGTQNQGFLNHAEKAIPIVEQVDYNLLSQLGRRSP